MRPPYQTKPTPPKATLQKSRLDLRVVLDEVVDAREDEAADAGGDDELVGELRRHAAAAHQRAHDGQARHDERQGGHEAEAVEAEVADLEEDGSHLASV